MIKELLEKGSPVAPRGMPVFLLSAIPYLISNSAGWITRFLLSFFASVTSLFFSTMLMIALTINTTNIIFISTRFLSGIKKARTFLMWPGCSLRCTIPYRSNHGRILSSLFLFSLIVNPLPAGT